MAKRWHKNGSKMTMKTSLSKEYLESFGISLRNGYLFDLEKLRYIKNREDAVSVEVFNEKPEYESEVLRFASRFI